MMPMITPKLGYLGQPHYLFSYYKVFGPHIGCLYGKRERLLEAKGQYHYFIGEDRLPYKLNPAGPQHEIIASLTGIGDYIETLYGHHFGTPLNNLHQKAKAVAALGADYEQTLTKRFYDFVASKPRIKMVGPGPGDPADRAPTFAFTVDGLASVEIPPQLEPERVVVSNGNFYAHRLVTALDLYPDDGVVRASMVHYTTMEEVERLISGLDRVIPD